MRKTVNKCIICVLEKLDERSKKVKALQIKCMTKRDDADAHSTKRQILETFVFIYLIKASQKQHLIKK